ncbi:hypothetical protein DVH24_034702 [Malus domestica]|uniref:Uncharacterized protein n=1 Tax=Malus domestica TaxID=3750 RepID=A0A498J1E9_MALDO|nr:hypothetical protein DVH24_034702 [Malus domestica]
MSILIHSFCFLLTMSSSRMGRNVQSPGGENEMEEEEDEECRMRDDEARSQRASHSSRLIQRYTSHQSSYYHKARQINLIKYQWELKQAQEN